MVRRISYYCDNCGKLVSKRVDINRFNSSRHHFCSQKCYNEYRHREKHDYKGNINISPQLKKILYYAEVRKKIR